MAKIYFGSNLLLYNCLKLLKKLRKGMVYPDTDICIDGYPKQANTFLVKSFLMWNPDKKVASHVHVPMQIHKALQYKIPCVVTIRDPYLSIASTLANDSGLIYEVAIWGYVHFYKSIYKIKNEVVIAGFDEAIESPGKIIKSLNERYGTDFNYEMRKIEKNELISDNEATPWRTKNAMKEELKGSKLIKEAESLYASLIQK